VNDAALLKTLKQALPYLRRHKGQVMVLKLGGEIAASKPALASLAEDISLLVHVGVRVVVVHGGGPQVSDLSRRLGLTPQLIEGRRVTDEETLDVAKMVFAGRINTDILSVLRTQGVRAVGLSGVDADILGAVRRQPVEIQDKQTGETRVVDFGLVGDVQEVDSSVLRLLMENGYVPVLASLGADADGNILNINADTVAAVIAQDLGAAKLISLTSVAGVLENPGDPGSLISLLTLSEARALLTTDAIAGGMKPKIQSLVDAVEGGVDRAHILSGVEVGSLLLELFTRTGCGTLIVGEQEHSQVLAGGRATGRGAAHKGLETDGVA
jgi:acetylglutamate kinase